MKFEIAELYRAFFGYGYVLDNKRRKLYLNRSDGAGLFKYRLERWKKYL